MISLKKCLRLLTGVRSIPVTCSLLSPVWIPTSGDPTIKTYDGGRSVIVKVSTMAFKTLFGLCLLLVAAAAQKSATDLVADMYGTCLKDYSFGCVKPKAISWFSQVSNDEVIQITEDLSIVKDPQAPTEEQRGAQDVFDNFENFLATHRLVAKMPVALKEGALDDIVPRSLVPEDVNMPLVETGRSKFVKKVMIPFLLGLKFKTAVLVPLALALIALKTWKAMTLGLLSLVLTGAMLIFKFTKPKIVNYEVVHYPHHHDVHHVEHAAPAGWDHAGYGRELTGDQLAYNAYQP
ncbi:Osiris 18 [Carabus blaptoides fortunei]